MMGLLRDYLSKAELYRGLLGIGELQVEVEHYMPLFHYNVFGRCFGRCTCDMQRARNPLVAASP